MADALSYAPPKAWYRRRRWIPILTLPVLLLGYTLALPHYRTLRQHQIRRVEIRHQFDAQLEKARKSLDDAQLDSAAIALLYAEFPIRTEQKLFWPAEIDNCQRQLQLQRARLHELYSQEQARFERILEDEAKRGIVRRGCTFPNMQRRLIVRAIEELGKGNNRIALAICDQIVALYPDHVFDDQFWADALRPH